MCSSDLQLEASPYERTAAVSKAVPSTRIRQAVEPTTIRGPSVQAPALSLRAELEPEIVKRERAAQEATGQQELFTEGDQGELFGTPKTIAQEVKGDEDIVTRYNREMPELNKRISRLDNIVKKIGALEKEAISDVNLAETKQELSDLEKTAQSLTLVGDQ